MKVLARVQYESPRALVDRLIDNWDKTEREIVEQLTSYWDLVGGLHGTSLILWPLKAMVESLRAGKEFDSEDQRVAAIEYLYQCYVVRAVVKHLTEPHWRVAFAQWEKHFWYCLGECRGSTADTAKRQLENQLEFTSLSFEKFVKLIG